MSLVVASIESCADKLILLSENIGQRIDVRTLPVVQNLEAIAKDGSLNVIFPNELNDLLGIELLEL